jgi:hypothetical protein
MGIAMLGGEPARRQTGGHTCEHAIVKEIPPVHS